MSRLRCGGRRALLSALPAAAQKRPVTIDDILGTEGRRLADGLARRHPGALHRARSGSIREGPHGIAHAHLEGAGRPAAPRGRSRSASAATRSRSGRRTAATSASSRRAAPARGDDAPRAQIYLMRADGGEAWKLTDAKEGVAVLRLGARQHAHRVRHDRSARSGDDEAAHQQARRRARVRRRLPLSRTSGTIDVDVEGTATRDHRAARAYTVARRAVVVARQQAPRRSARSRRRCCATTGRTSTSPTSPRSAIEKISTNPGADAQPAVVARRQHDRVGRASRRRAKPIGDGTLPSTSASAT